MNWGHFSNILQKWPQCVGKNTWRIGRVFMFGRLKKIETYQKPAVFFQSVEMTYKPQQSWFQR